MSASSEGGAAAPLALRPLLVELNDLKRVHAAGRTGSIAERLFAQGWGALTGGAPAEDVALDITAKALAAARLCDLDAAFLAAAGLDLVHWWTDEPGDFALSLATPAGGGADRAHGRMDA